MRNSVFLSVLMLSLLVISPIALVAAQGPYPVSGATVGVSGTNGQGSATTDSNGNFLITQGLWAGFYDVDVGRAGYVTVHTNATVTQGGTTDMGDIYLNVSARVTGTVHTPSAGAASGIIVELLDHNNDSIADNFTQSDGTFVIDTDVPTGTYSIATFVPSGPYAPAPILSGVSAVEGQTTPVGILTLTQSGTISGTVTNSLANGVANVSITAVGPNSVGYATTDSLGHYSISSNLGAGSYNVSTFGYPEGYVVNSSDVRSVSVTTGQTTTVNFVVQNSGSISGTVTLANSDPAPGVTVTAFSSSGFFGSATTKSDGTYLINSGLGTDMYSVIAGSDYLNTQTVSVTAGSLTPNVNFQLGYNLAWIAGTVRSATAPLPSADLTGVLITGTDYAFTDLTGAYMMTIELSSGVTSMQVNVTASATGYADASQVVTATVGQTTSNVNFILQAVQGGSLKGRVVTNNPPPLQNAVLALSPSSNSITLGSQLTLSGTLSPSQAGTVTIYESINGSAWTTLTSVALSSGSYTYAFSPSALGTYQFYASWPGNAQYNPANSSTKQVTVSQVVLQNAALSIQPSAPSISLGSSLTVSGTLSPSRSGTATIWESINGSAFTMLNAATLVSGAYSYAFTPSSLGSYQFYASWPGDSQYNPANSTITSVTVAQVVLQNAALSIQASAQNVTIGSALTVSGALTPSRSGTATIWESINGSAFTMLNAATLVSGAYTYTFNPSAVGSYQFKATWPGDPQYNSANSSTTTVTVAAVQPTIPTLTLQSSATNVNPGQTVTLSGTITPSATGNVTLSQSVNSSAYQQIANVTLANGAYSYQYTILGNGTYTFQASFAGNSQLNPAQSSAVTVSSALGTPTDYTWYIVGGVIILAIIVLAVYMIVLRPKTKPT